MDNGARLRKWRKEHGLSQHQAAQLIGTKQRTWASWEVHGATPEIDFAEAIEKLTNGEISMHDWARARRRQRREEARAA